MFHAAALRLSGRFASGSKLLIFSPPPKTVFRFPARNYEQSSRSPSGAEHKRFFGLDFAAIVLFAKVAAGDVP